MSAWLYDVRQAIVASWRRPLFTTLLVAVLAVGIGAAVAMFSVLNAVVLRPLPYGDPQRLMWLLSIRADGTPTAFAMMGIRLLRGRAFDERDASPAVDVAIVNKTMADRLWPNENPIGSHLVIEPATRAVQRVQVVGVVGDVKHYGLDTAPTMDLYVPFGQLPERNVIWVTNNQFWTIRTSEAPMTLAAAARAALAAADPDVPAADVRTLEQAVDNALTVRRFSMWVVALFGYAALALTACGIYAVSAHAVAERSRELGIRAALGASPRGLVALVLRTDFACVIGGIVAGLIAARAASSAIRGLLFDVGAADPGPYAMVAVLLRGRRCCLLRAGSSRRAHRSGRRAARVKTAVQTKGRHIGCRPHLQVVQLSSVLQCFSLQ